MARRQIVEITEDGRVLGVERGFLIVSCKKEIFWRATHHEFYCYRYEHPTGYADYSDLYLVH